MSVSSWEAVEAKLFEREADSKQLRVDLDDLGTQVSLIQEKLSFHDCQLKKVLEGQARLEKLLRQYLGSSTPPELENSPKNTTSEPNQGLFPMSPADKLIPHPVENPSSFSSCSTKSSSIPDPLIVDTTTVNSVVDSFLDQLSSSIDRVSSNQVQVLLRTKLEVDICENDFPSGLVSELVTRIHINILMDSAGNQFEFFTNRMSYVSYVCFDPGISQPQLCAFEEVGVGYNASRTGSLMDIEIIYFMQQHYQLILFQIQIDSFSQNSKLDAAAMVDGGLGKAQSFPWPVLLLLDTVLNIGRSSVRDNNSSDNSTCIVYKGSHDSQRLFELTLHFLLDIIVCGGKVKALCWLEIFYCRNIALLKNLGFCHISILWFLCITSWNAEQWKNSLNGEEPWKNISGVQLVLKLITETNVALITFGSGRISTYYEMINGTRYFLLDCWGFSLLLGLLAQLVAFGISEHSMSLVISEYNALSFFCAAVEVLTKPDFQYSSSLVSTQNSMHQICDVALLEHHSLWDSDAPDIHSVTAGAKMLLVLSIFVQHYKLQLADRVHVLSSVSGWFFAMCITAPMPIKRQRKTEYKRKMFTVILGAAMHKRYMHLQLVDIFMLYANQEEERMASNIKNKGTPKNRGWQVYKLCTRRMTTNDDIMFEISCLGKLSDIRNWVFSDILSGTAGFELGLKDDCPRSVLMSCFLGFILHTLMNVIVVNFVLMKATEESKDNMQKPEHMTYVLQYCSVVLCYYSECLIAWAASSQSNKCITKDIPKQMDAAFSRNLWQMLKVHTDSVRVCTNLGAMTTSIVSVSVREWNNSKAKVMDFTNRIIQTICNGSCIFFLYTDSQIHSLLSIVYRSLCSTFQRGDSCTYAKQELHQKVIQSRPLQNRSPSSRAINYEEAVAKNFQLISPSYDDLVALFEGRGPSCYLLRVVCLPMYELSFGHINERHLPALLHAPWVGYIWVTCELVHFQGWLPPVSYSYSEVSTIAQRVAMHFQLADNSATFREFFFIVEKLESSVHINPSDTSNSEHNEFSITFLWAKISAQLSTCQAMIFTSFAEHAVVPLNDILHPCACSSLHMYYLQAWLLHLRLPYTKVAFSVILLYVVSEQWVLSKTALDVYWLNFWVLVYGLMRTVLGLGMLKCKEKGHPMVLALLPDKLESTARGAKSSVDSIMIHKGHVGVEHLVAWTNTNFRSFLSMIALLLGTICLCCHICQSFDLEDEFALKGEGL